MELSNVQPTLGNEDIHPVRTVVNLTFPTWESVTPSYTRSLGAKLGPFIEMPLVLL